MSYSYEREKAAIYTPEGLKMLVDLRDQIRAKCKSSGAVRFDAISFSGDSWTALACLDFMIERGDLKRVTEGQNRAAQYHIYEWVEGK
jgi:hypothetical protein